METEMGACQAALWFGRSGRAHLPSAHPSSLKKRGSGHQCGSQGVLGIAQ